MRKFIRIIVRRFWGLCAFLLIGLAVVVTIGRELSPQVNNYRGDIASWMTQRLGVQVDLDAVALSWEGLSPELRLRGLRLTGPEGEAILSVQRGLAELDLLRSLVNWQLALGQLEFSTVVMGFQQNEEGNWSLRGLPPWADRNEQIDINDPLDIFLLGHQIEIRDARFSFDFRTGHSSRVQLPHLVLENSGNFHRLRSEVAVDRNRDVLALVVEAYGDPRSPDNFTAQGYLRLQQFELDKALAALPGSFWRGLPDQEWRKGHSLDLEAWFDVSEGMAVETRGWLDIGELPVALEQSVAMPRRTTASFAGRLLSGGQWELGFNNLHLEWDQVAAPELDLRLSSAGFGKPLNLQTARVDLAQWSEVLRGADLLQGKAREALDALQPTGALENLRLSLAGTRLADLTLRANLVDVGVASWHGAPELKQVDGYIEGNPFTGHVDVASRAGFSMHYPTIYKDTLAFDRAVGRVHWQVDLEERAVNVHSGLVSVSSEVGEGRGYFSLFVPFDFGSQPEELVVQVGLRGSKAQYHRQFVPYVLPDSLISWLNQSVGEGDVSSGGFIYRGGFSKGAVEQAAIQLFLNVEDAELAYHPDWPTLRNASGVMWLDDRRILAHLDNATILDTELQAGELTVEAEGAEVTLQITGRARGDAADGLRVVRETPVAGLIDTALLADWQASGPMQTVIDMTLPLTSGQPVIDRLDVEFDDVRLETFEGLEFTNLRGQVSYREGEGLGSSDLGAVLWGNAVSATLLPGAESDRSARLTLAGTASIEKLRQWTGRPELALASGESAVTAELLLPFGAAAPQMSPSLEFASDLKGIAVELPAPFGKHAEESRSLNVSVPLSGGNLQTAFRYGDQVKGLVEFDDGEMRRAGIRLGGAEPVLPASRTIALNGQLEYFQLKDWQPLVDRFREDASDSVLLTGSGTDWKHNFDVQFDRFALDDFVVEDLKLTGSGNAKKWQFAMESETVAGKAQLALSGTEPFLLELQHLRLPAPEPQRPEHFNPFVEYEEGESDLLAQLDPRTLPAINFAVRDFSVGEDHFGTWSFQLKPTATGVVLSQIIGNVRGGQIIGQQIGQGAELHWDKVDGEVKSRFKGRFVTANLGSVLEQWNQPHLLDSESSRFDAELSWPGSPAAISLTSLQGDIFMDVEQGTFVRGAGEATTGGALLELIAFFNFDTWLRRLRLDFSDLNRAGTAFQTIKGALQFDHGKVYMNTPMVVNSNSSRFQMAGVVDLVRSELDTKLVATIPVGGNLTFVAALTGMGLPAVAGMWLISKVFEEQIGKMSSLSFHVTGPLDDPEMDFVRLFDDQVVQKDVSASLD
ncbi:TIGR02099 family protein [Proteobacteria bacterium 005FR1]|nr:TIGR02099 family protein [Proteobacteria bacterium 005FR1]